MVLMTQGWRAWNSLPSWVISRVNEPWDVHTLLLISPAAPVFFATGCGHILHLSWLDPVLTWRSLAMQSLRMQIFILCLLCQPSYLPSVLLKRYALSCLKGSSHAVSTVSTSLSPSFAWSMFCHSPYLTSKSHILRETVSNVQRRAGPLSVIQSILILSFVTVT